MLGHVEGQLGPLVAAIGEALQAGLTSRDDGQFGHGENPVQQNEEEDDGERDEDHGPSGSGTRRRTATAARAMGDPAGSLYKEKRRGP